MLTAAPNPLPDPRTMDSEALTTAMEAWIAYTAQLYPAITQKIAEFLALTEVTVYNASTTYNEGDTVYGVDQMTYRCTADGTVGISPGITSGWTSNWVGLTMKRLWPLYPATHSITQIFGGNYSRYASSTDTIYIDFLSCWDDTNQYPIYCNDQVVTLDTGGSRVNNLFACADGVVRVDESNWGANLDAAHPIKAWVGWAPTNVAGELKAFIQHGPVMIFSNTDDWVLGSGGVTTTPAVVGHSSYNTFPDGRIQDVLYGVNGATGNWIKAVDSDGNTECVIGESAGTTDPTSINAWGSSGSNLQGWLPYSSNRLFATNAGTQNLLLHGVRMRRT